MVSSAWIPAIKEPPGLSRLDGKWPDGLTLIPWHAGKPLVWDVTVVSTLAQSYVNRAATGVGAVVDMAAKRKREKYDNLSSNHIFQPIAMENLGAFSSSSLEFLRELGHRLGSLSGEEREACFFFQRPSVAIHRFNSRPAFRFSDSPFSFSVSMLFYFLIVLWRRRKSKDHSSLFSYFVFA